MASEIVKIGGRTAVLILLFAALALPSSAQELTPAGQSLPGLWSGALAWGDYDGDGDADLALVGLTGPADGSAPVSRVYRNSNGVLTDIGAGLTGIYLGAAAWGDYDGDGDLDLALSGLTAQGSGLLTVYRNEGGSLVEDTAQTELVPVRYSSLAWADYDNDGDLDLVVSGMTIGGSTLTTVYRNARINRNRIGSPLGGRPVLEVDRPNTERVMNLCQGNLAWGDYDNDGDLDLALSGFGTGGTRQAALYLNQPTGTLVQDTGNDRLTSISGGDLAWGDYDNDGDLDLALSGWSSEWEAVFKLYTNTAGILRENQTFSSTRVIGALAWGDYDNDGDLDLAVCGQTSTSGRSAFVLKNHPLGSLNEDRAQSLTGLRGGDVAWVDVEADGDLDLVVSGEDATGLRRAVVYASSGVAVSNTPPSPPDRLSTPFVTGSGLSLNWNDGADAQTPGIALTYTLRIGTSSGEGNVFSGAISVGPGNVGSRKTVELAIPLARDTYYWSVRAVDGGFVASAESQEELFRVQDLVSSRQSLRPLQNSAMAWGDYDGDGDLDLVLADQRIDGTARSLVYRSDAGNLVENSNIVLQGVQDGDLAWGDFDSDDDLDLALTGADAAGNRNTHVYRNRLESGDFVLVASIVQNLPQLASSSLAWGDYDNDGDLDLALMGTGLGARIATIFQNTDGAFVEDTTQSLTPMDNGDLAWGDYDDDDDLDLVAIGQTDNQGRAALAVYQNSPLGTLAQDGRASLTGALASSLAWGDYDNDGDLDLAACGYNVFEGLGLMTRVYGNDGTGLLSEAGVSLPGVAAGDLAWGDYDNDGDLDLALMGQAASGLLNIYRKAPGGFESVPIDVLTGVDYGAVTWADYDNDGDLDLASTGRTSPDPTTFLPISKINDNLESRFNPNTRPTSPSGLASVASGSKVTLSWIGSTDAYGTPEVALTYALRVGTQPGGNQIRSGAAPLRAGRVRDTDFFLTDLHSGRYYWAVRAIDQGILSSLWSAEASFIIDVDKPTVDSVKVQPKVFSVGSRVTVLVSFYDEPAGMDNAASPQVTLQPSGGGDALSVRQLSFSGGLWIGEADIQTPTPAGTVVVNVQGAKDLKGNEMAPHQAVLPASIAADFGGMVENGDKTVTFTISPNALPTLTENPDIRILSRPVDAPPSGATAVGQAYEVVSVPEFQLRKAATLAIAYDPAGVDESRLAVYRLNGTAWTRLGGTVEAETNRVLVPVEQFGVYAVFQDAAPASGALSVANIDFSNRAFSPLGGAGAGRPAGNPLTATTDISFELGAAADVRVEIYNRAGRLQRVLESGRQMGAGRQIITWDGRDHSGRIVRSGLYIVVIDADGKKAQKTLAVVNR